jgi:threonyl-tRNA synthetase
MVELVLPDGSKLKVKAGTSCWDAVRKISEKLASATLVAKLNGKLVDLETPAADGEFTAVTFDMPEGKEIFRHSSSHILALAVKRLFPRAKFAIGPAIEDGYYYDFDVERPFTPDDLKKIEKEMEKIVREKMAFQRKVVPKEEAMKIFKNEQYKIELIKDLPDGEIISLYRLGEFVDLCRGPHVPHSGFIKAFKLKKVAGAYWRGDSKNKMLQRIYGTSFPSKKELDKYLKMLEEAEKRDHRKLGTQLDLFSFHEEAPGMCFWHPKGWVLWKLLVDFWRNEHRKRGYREINTPMILNRDLWMRSGHWDHFKENMYFTKIDDVDFAVKPMNCPGGMLVYKRKTWSYRELPLRVGELGLVHRHELSGALSGLLRVRCFTQDDAHIFMTEDQMISEITNLLRFIDYMYKIFGFEYHVELSTKPEKAMGSEKTWNKAESVLQEAMKEIGWDYKVNPGDGAFYGPKLDFHLKDAIGRTWQCGTVQLDFLMPEKFDLEYVGKDGQKHRPIMLHRVIYGSLERIIAVLIEHYAGKFPVWLSPIQVRVLTLTDRQNKYAKKVFDKLFENNVRVELDNSQNTIEYKIRDAQMQKVPYMLVIGDKEETVKTIAIRSRDGKKEFGIKVDDFIKRIQREIKEFK